MIPLMGSSVLSQSAAVADTAFAINNSAISFSDYCNIAVSPTAAVFSRPSVDLLGVGFASANPGARVRFSTNSQAVRVDLRWTNAITNPALFNSVGHVLVDGVSARAFSAALGTAVTIPETISFPSAVSRTIEIVLPYGASVDVLAVWISAGASLVAAPARSSVRLVAMGDSITHGYYASSVVSSWAWRLADAKGWQCINHGYGGRQCVPADGTALASLNPSVATYLIGYNDFAAQKPLATFRSEFTAFVNNFRAVNTTARLYCITPIYSTSLGTIPLESYRQQIRDVLATLANPLNILVEGLPLMANDVSRLFDAVHPNDVGGAEIAASLNSIVNL